jgi:hypothetical protein
MDAVEAQRRLEAVQRALKVVRKGAPFTRQEVFSDVTAAGREFQRRVLNKLVEAEAVRKVSNPHGKVGAVYQLKDVGKIDKLIADKEKLSEFIWAEPQPPALRLPFSPEPVEEVKKVLKEPEGGAVAPPSHEEAAQPAPFFPSSLDQEGIGETNRLLGELLEVMNAAFQSAIYTRDQMDALSKRMESMEKKVAGVAAILEALK